MNKNPQLELAFNYLEYTNQNIFLTGKAGTGKTTFLHKLRERSPKRMIVVAPTGVAAINAGGVTIHSFFQMPFGPNLPHECIATQNNETQKAAYTTGYAKLNKTKIAIIKSLDLLIIDEISMVRADLLDGVDDVLRRYRNEQKPFGGVQLLMIGDIQQLSPVIKNDEWELLRSYYDTVYFFSSRALQNIGFTTLELKHIYRQSDRDFINILNCVRENRLDKTTLAKLNERYLPDFKGDDKDGYITLTTHNNRAQALNKSKLATLNKKTYSYQASVDGDFSEYAYPTEYELKLKTGAQVMFVKNDISTEKRYYNGKIGIVTEIDEEEDVVYVTCQDDDVAIAVERVEWQNCKYSINPETKEIEEAIVGSFLQYPLKLAWAITIHKSQGLTFEKAIIDANTSFAHGQVYVALSRCRSIEGMVLSSPIAGSSIKTDKDVLDFSLRSEENPPDEKQLASSRQEYQKEMIFELFGFSKVQSCIYHCIKVVKVNSASLLTDLSVVFQNMNKLVKKEIEQVANKFQNQLSHIVKEMKDMDQDQYLQERISKGAAYFNEKLNSHILEIMNGLSVETDNKKVRKELQDCIDKLYHEDSVKQACLQSCASGFVLKNYLNVRAKASIKEPVKKSSKSTAAEKASIDIQHQELFDKLRDWRKQKAAKLGLSAYIILHQKMLVDISVHLPSSLSELASLKGIGPKRIKEHGQEILEIVQTYCQEKKLDFNADFDTPLEDKKSKTNTKVVTLELFKKGKNIKEIAAERGLVISTVEGHLAHYIGTGDIAVSEIVDNETINMISNYCQKNWNSKLAETKVALGNKISFGQIKMVQAHLRKKV